MSYQLHSQLATGTLGLPVAVLQRKTAACTRHQPARACLPRPCQCGEHELSAESPQLQHPGQKHLHQHTRQSIPASHTVASSHSQPPSHVSDPAHANSHGHHHVSGRGIHLMPQLTAVAKQVQEAVIPQDLDTLPRHDTDANVWEHHGAESQSADYPWSKQWYPLAGVQDLDPSRPNSFSLLGQRLVVWQDRNAEGGPKWRCFADSCPHRQVPLSEGRIHTDGTLMCCYHGWRFNGEGRPISIPALAEDPAQEQRICCTKGSSVAAHPVELRHGLLFVWGEGGAMAALESQSRPVPVGDVPASVPEDELVSLYSNFTRDLPGSFDVWMENMVDQSHVAFAHHGAAGNREGEMSGRYHQPQVKMGSDPDLGFSYRFDWSPKSTVMLNNTLFRFTPPCLSSFQLPSGDGGLWIYAVPTTANTTRLIINGGKRIGKTWLVKLINRLAPRWLTHLQLNAITDGDIVFMHRQAEGNARARAENRGEFNWRKHYFLPGENDRGVLAFREWLHSLAGGGPFATKSQAQQDAEVQHATKWLNTFGNPDRRHMLARDQQHTQNCSSCSQMLQRVQLARQAALAFSGACFLTIAAQLHQGDSVTLAAAGLLSAIALHQGLGKVERQFVFTDWVNQDNP